MSLEELLEDVLLKLHLLLRKQHLYTKALVVSIEMHYI
jgi:hypothetical protein